jgi:HTH-type transcriptional regulator / antitoxin MqsA
MSMSKFKPVKARPFPWKCRKCGRNAVRAAIVSYPVEIDHDGRVYAITVHGLKSPLCQECGQVFPDAGANRQLSQEFPRQAKLLTPQQIRRNREALGLTQKQLANIFGFAEATVSRWETGSQFQQRSLDNFLRVFFAFPEVRKALMDAQHVQKLGLVVAAGTAGASAKTGST